MEKGELPRHPLCFLPTPVHELTRLSDALGGPRIVIKRDDLTGLGLGGNKTRKLEYLIGDALAAGCDTVITGGAEQSNHSRQTAAAAAVAGLSCHLALGGEPVDNPDGNLLIDLLCGATIHWTGELRKGERIPEIAAELESQGRKPYIIPYGGSNAVGAAGFAAAAAELQGQLDEYGENVDHVVIPSSSGGTQAGLVVGAAAFDLEANIIGIEIDKDEVYKGSYEDFLASLANATAERLGAKTGFEAKDFVVRRDYSGPGYGVVTDLERQAIKLVGEQEGIILDPVYTGRAMGGLIDMIEKGEFSKDETVLFWHTGGVPAVFHYAGALTAGGD